MTAVATSSRSGRRLNASGRARRAKRAAAKRRQMVLSVGGGLAVVIGAPLTVASYMGIESALPGVEAARSFLAMMADRSPGDRTKAELTKIKRVAAAAPPRQRALGKIAKPEPPKQFVEAIAPPLPKVIEDVPVALTPMASLGPLLITPQPPGGGIIIPPQAPPPGGGGPNPPPPEQPPPPGGGVPTPNVQPPPVIPEPGTWATMLLGFGLTGWMIRRRRRKAAALNPA